MNTAFQSIHQIHTASFLQLSFHRLTNAYSIFIDVVLQLISSGTTSNLMAYFTLQVGVQASGCLWIRIVHLKRYFENCRLCAQGKQENGVRLAWNRRKIWLTTPQIPLPTFRNHSENDGKISFRSKQYSNDTDSLLRKVVSAHIHTRNVTFPGTE